MDFLNFIFQVYASKVLVISIFRCMAKKYAFSLLQYSLKLLIVAIGVGISAFIGM